MNLIKKNISFYIRYYKLIAMAVMITTAVIVGSLLVGESVRSTLVKRVHERLGDTETILFSMNSFIESSVAQDPLFEGNAQAILLSNGFVSDAGRLIPVTVWGIDNKEIPSGGVRMNPALASELAVKNTNEDIVLRLPATGLVPSGSLFVTDNYTTSARLAFSGIVDPSDGGNLNLKNEQIIPYNIFLNRSELASILKIENKINLILYNHYLSSADFAGIWKPSLSGIKETDKNNFVEITSDRVFIREEAVQKIYANNPGANRMFSYLANSISTTSKEAGNIPYSFVTAVDQYKGKALKEGELILSDYSANRLQVHVNDSIRLTYYTSSDLKTLHEDTLYAKIVDIVPIAGLFADATLSADFPGLSDVEKCTDWDSDLPIDMNLISKEDEDYWSKYRSTPKALISYNAVSEHWKNAYGSATAIRISSSQPVTLNDLDASMFGVQLIHPKEIGLNAALGGVDFASLFLSLGFFIILSALLLMLVPLSEMIHQRQNEIALLKALGYHKKRIVRLFWTESAPVVFVSSFIGAIAGFVYTWLVLLLLGSLWKGATQTGGFILFPDIKTILTGLSVGTGITLILLYIAIVRSLKSRKPQNKTVRQTLNRKLIFAISSTVAALVLIVINLAFIHSQILFVLVGIVLITTAAAWGDYVISTKGTVSNKSLDSKKLIWANIYANRKRVLLAFFTLTTGIFIVFSVGLNRKGFIDSSQLLSGTGGFSLWCESSVPIYHNMATPQGKEELALIGLPENATVLQIFRYSADDASCLNLNKVSQPTVLGIDMDVLKESRFEIQNSMYPGNSSVWDSVRNPSDSIYPVLIDETVLVWGLMKNLGDTILYENDKGQKVYLRISGTLKNSIFQGNILIDKKLFSSIWSETTGSEIFLLKVDESDSEKTKMLLSQALNEYGIKITTTTQRLQAFYSVTDTYLNIFLSLGGIGLLLGIMSFIIVIRKDIVSREQQIRIFRSLGFTERKIARMLITENMLCPLYAIVVGIIGSLAGLGTNISNVSIWVGLSAFLLTLIFILCVIVFIKRIVYENIVYSPRIR